MGDGSPTPPASMERDGHLGITLLLYTPIAAALSTTTASGSTPVLGFGLAGMVVWSLVPDVDELLPIPHRGPTHSVAAAGFAGLVTALLSLLLAVTGRLTTPDALAQIGIHQSLAAAVFGLGIGVFGVTSHLLGDVITPMGVRPWWPYSDRRYSLSLVLSADVRTNLVLAYAGTLALVGVLLVAR